MKLANSKRWEISLKDLWKILFLAFSFIGGFYLANTEVANELIWNNVKPEHVAITTAFVAYIFKQLVKDNSKETK